MATTRRIEVDLDGDDYSIAERLWEMFRKVPVSGHSTKPSKPERRTLVARSSALFDFFDEDGNTPLMRAVEHNYLKTAFNLLLFCCNPNLQHERTGDTALHLAVDNGNLVLIKALLACNADPTIRNKDNQTPLDVAKFLKRKITTPDVKTGLGLVVKGLFSFDADNGDSSCTSKREIKEGGLTGDIDGIITVLTDSIDLQAKTLDYFEKHSTIPPPRNSSEVVLLSLDGAGTSTYNVTQALINIEERICQLSKTKERLYSYFDYLAGTATGGMVACALAYLEADGYNVRAMIGRVLLHVLNAPKSERGERMDSVFHDMFTEDRSMAELDPHYRVIVTASLAETTPLKLHLMTSYGEPRDSQAGPKERKVWEACRISTAAPSLFPLLRDLKLLDGGLVANNPTLDGMAEILEQGKREGKPAKLGCVISIGSGVPPKVKNEEVEFFATSTIAMLSIKNIHALQNLAKHFLNQTVLANGQEVSCARSFCSALGCQYFRFSPQLHDQPLDMGTLDEAKLIEMLYQTQMYYLDNPELIDNVAKYLLSK